MVRVVQTLGVLALICAGALLVHCADQWPDATSGIEPDPKPSLVEQFRRTGRASTGGSQERLSPLVEQAVAFALYLSPPEPAKPRERPRVTSSSKKTVAPVKLADTTAKFTLVATSYYGARPEKSLALVSEPGRGTRWVRPGTRMGHFVLEKVEQGSIVYRDGNRSSRMAVKTKIPVRHKGAPQITLASGETEATPPKPSTPRKPRRTRERPPMQRLGPVRPESPLLVRNQLSTNG